MTGKPSNASRADLKQRLFEIIDKDGDDHLKKGEMRELAKLVGFAGSDEEWMQEYLKLCDEVRVLPSKGIPKAVVLRLLDDKSETGCFCTEEELQTLLRGFEKKDKRSEKRQEPREKEKGQKEKGQKDKEEKEKKFEKPREGENSISFSGIPHWTSEEAMRKFFWYAGEVTSMRVFRLKDGTSRGMGCVTFASAKQAKRAVRDLHGQEMNGYRIQVTAFDKDGKGKMKSEKSGEKSEKSEKEAQHFKGWYGEDEWHEDWYGGGREDYSTYDQSAYSTGYALYFVGAPFEMEEHKLLQMFKDYGKISRFWLFRLPDGRSRGQGLVEYTSREAARSAVHYLHGRRLGERTLKVQEDEVGALDQRHSYKDSYGYVQGASASSQWDNCSVFFSGAPSQTPKKVVQSYFEEYGEVEQFNVFRHPNGKPKGMGVVTFRRADGAVKVLMYGVEVEGWQLFLKEADPNPRHARNGGYSAESEWYEDGWTGDSWQQSYGSYTPKVNPEKSLYFTNVAWECSEAALRQRFAKFGAVKNIHLVRTKDGYSKGRGVVEYGSVASANRAYNNLHHAVFDGRKMVLDEFRPEVFSY